MIFRYNIYCLKTISAISTSYNKIGKNLRKNTKGSVIVTSHVARHPTEIMVTARIELLCTLCPTIVSHGRNFQQTNIVRVQSITQPCRQHRSNDSSHKA